MTLPEKMKALIQTQDGYAAEATGPHVIDLSPYLALEEVAVPVPGVGEAVIKVDLAAVNPSDIHFIKGEYGQPRVKGAPAGFEGVGTVVAGETPLVGQRVSFYATASGTWAQYAMTDVAGLVPCRPDLSEVDAAGQIVNPLTAIAMFEIVKQAGAESFVLTAAGSQLCKLMIGLGRDAGIKPIAIVRRSVQAEALKALGAAEVIVSTDDGAMAQAADVFSALKPRILLDAVGDQFTAELFFAMPKGARWVNYGKLSAEPPVLTNLGQLIFQGKQIEGFWLTRWMQEVPPERIIAAFTEIQERFVSGAWVTDVAGIVPLDRVMQDLPGVLAQPDGKAFIDPR